MIKHVNEISDLNHSATGAASSQFALELNYERAFVHCVNFLFHKIMKVSKNLGKLWARVFIYMIHVFEILDNLPIFS